MGREGVFDFERGEGFDEFGVHGFEAFGGSGEEGYFFNFWAGFEVLDEVS